MGFVDLNATILTSMQHSVGAVRGTGVDVGQKLMVVTSYEPTGPYYSYLVPLCYVVDVL